MFIVTEYAALRNYMYMYYCHCHETETKELISYVPSGFPKHRFKCAFDDGLFGSKNFLAIKNAILTKHFIRLWLTRNVSENAICYACPFDVIAQIYPYKLYDTFIFFPQTKYGCTVVEDSGQN